MSAHRVTSLPEMVATLPFMLGYHPSDVLIAVFIGGERASVASVVWGEPASGLASDPGGLSLALDSVTRAGADTVVLIAVDAADGPERIQIVGDAAHDAGMRVHTRAIVHGDLVTDLDAGTTEQVPPLSASATAEFVAVGVHPMPSREAIADAFEPTETEDTAAAWSADGHTLTDAVRAWTPILAPDAAPVASLPAEVIAKAASALEDVGTRDALMSKVIPGTPDEVAKSASAEVRTVIEGLPATPADGPSAAVVADRLRVMATRLSDEHATPTLTVAAALYWWIGDGARARIALDRALRPHPGYTLALVLMRMLDTGIRLQETAKA